MKESVIGPAPTVLLVEDDEQVRAFIASLLKGDGYRVIEAESGLAGLQAAENLENADLLISDMLLPELSGFDLAQSLQPRFPRMKVLFMTGYVEGDIVQRCVTELRASFLDKPFQPQKLLQTVRETLQDSQIRNGASAT